MFWIQFIRISAYLMVTTVFLYLINNYLVYWQDLPGTYALLEHFSWVGDDESKLEEHELTQALIQVMSYLTVLWLVGLYAFLRFYLPLSDDAKRFSNLSAYFIRSCFWAVLLIGFADTIISLLRVENMLEYWVNPELEKELGRPIFRGSYVHYPLLLLSFIIAYFVRTVSFTWLALMVVLAEFTIVITRFVFSYEQAYMGDIVRFWYAALFLFASANTLVQDGHVRVDVLYANLKIRTKSVSNTIGIILLGLPICWVILMQGMGGKANSINSPLLSFEISQSGYGLYIKYLMAGFLVVFAVSMIIQLCSYLLYNIHIFNSHEDDYESYQKVCGLGSKDTSKTEI